VYFRDGSCTEKVVVEYPQGHRRRRKEGIPLLLKKCRDNLSTRLSKERVEEVLDLCSDPGRLKDTPVNEFMELFIKKGTP
jgi:2-methylcitrate dehydratase